jgi:hypothetical protein
MEKPRLNEDLYIAELNRRLQEHPDYSPGMAFLPHPQGATGGNIMGIAIAGFGYNSTYIDVSNAVQNDFDVEVTYAGFQREVKG